MFSAYVRGLESNVPFEYEKKANHVARLDFFFFFFGFVTFQHFLHRMQNRIPENVET